MNSTKVVQRKKQELLPAIGGRAAEVNHSGFKVSAKSLDLKNIVPLLECPFTSDLKERHIFVLKKLLKRSQIGFLLKDLSGIARILNACAAKVKDDPEYLPILCGALKICGLPFLKERTSDELTYAQDAISFLSNLGCLMRVQEAEVQQLLLESVQRFFDGVSEQTYDGLQQTSPGYILQLVELSELPQTLLLSMSTLDQQPSIRLQLLRTLQMLTSCSDRSCSSILRAGGAQSICLHMTSPEEAPQLLFHSSELLWNLLERGGQEEVSQQLNSVHCLLSLKEVFFQQLLKASQPSDLQLRNDLLVIVTLIAQQPNSRLIESLFARDLLPFITYPEMKTLDPLVQKLKLSFNNEDLKMKKMMLNLLVLMSTDLAALKLFREAQVMLALLTLAQPPSSPTELRSTSLHWSSVQQEELQLQALATLTTIAPLMLEQYMRAQGNARLLLLLDWCRGHDAFFGQGHSFHGSGRTGSKKAQMRHCLRVLRAVTSEGQESVNQDLCDQGSIAQLLGILMQMESSPEEEEEALALEMKSDILVILSALCEHHVHTKELFGSEGVDMVVHFLKKGCEKFYSGLGHNKLVLSSVDCVWSCIVGCDSTEDYFLAKGGVCLLLDLLISSPRCVQGILLSTLLELSDNPNTPGLILSWSDPWGNSSPALLLRLWRQEEEEAGVNRSAQGAITDLQKPLLTRYQNDTETSYPANKPSASVMEISENLRSKIYSLFCKIGFQDRPGQSLKDHMTFSIVRKYLDFKVGEVWEEISRELVLDKVIPVSPDDEALSNIRKATENTARKVAQEQNGLLEKLQRESSSKEEHMYTEIWSHWKQQELMEKSWNSYVSKTSDRQVLKELKSQRKKKMESVKHGAGLEDLRPEQHFVGHVMSVRRSSAGGHGPAAVNVVLAGTSIKGAELFRSYFNNQLR